MSEIEQAKLDKMKYEILQKEDQNSKTKEKTRSEMVSALKDIIIKNVNEKNY